jgi:RNA recognition motif-containing protein
MKLLIRNLARSTTEAEIQALFEAYGTVQSCTLVMDEKSKQSKGFGFVDMPKAGEAKVAMKNLNGKEVAENKIRVKKSEAKPESAEEKTDSTDSHQKEKSNIYSRNRK